MNCKISFFISVSSAIVDTQCQRKDLEFDHAQQERTKAFSRLGLRVGN